MNRELLLAYAQAFVSFLFRAPGIKAGKVKSVYLFGSVARGDFDENSDVDIFISVNKADEKEMRKLSGMALRNFYRSEESGKFRLLGVDNRVSVKCGELEQWKLSGSIQSEGIVLYSSSPSHLFRKYFLVGIEPIGDIAKRNRVIRRLAGRKERQRKERGLLDEISGIALDSRHYIIPAEKISMVTKILSKESVQFEIREIWMT